MQDHAYSSVCIAICDDAKVWKISQDKEFYLGRYTFKTSFMHLHPGLCSDRSLKCCLLAPILLTSASDVFCVFSATREYQSENASMTENWICFFKFKFCFTKELTKPFCT